MGSSVKSTPEYHEGFYDGWTEGRELFAETIVNYLYYLVEYHVEVEPLVKDVIHAIEEELGRTPEDDEEEEGE